MSLASLTLMSARKGRPPAGARRAERLKHIRCTGLLLGDVVSADALARNYGVTVKTIYNWRDLALGYSDDEAEGMRRYIEQLEQRRRRP